MVQVLGTEHFRNVDRPEIITDPAGLSIQVHERLYFATDRALMDVILMCPAMNAIAASTLESAKASAHCHASAGVVFHL